MGIGIAAAFIAIGLGGLRNAVLPKWFAITTTVLGVLSLLGACSIPPGGLVNYLLLPFWLITLRGHAGQGGVIGSILSPVPRPRRTRRSWTVHLRVRPVPRGLP